MAQRRYAPISPIERAFFQKLLQHGVLPDGVRRSPAPPFGGTYAQPGSGSGALSAASVTAAIRLLAQAERRVEPKPALESSGITVGELVGYRIWRLRRADRLLESYSAERIWLPDEPMTGQPGDHNSAGVWAFKEGFDAAKKLREAEGIIDPFRRTTEERVLGSVWLWGNVVEHEIGYRAEFARVRSIDAVPDSLALNYDPSEAAAPTASFLQFHKIIRRREVEQVRLLAGDERMLDALRQRYGVGSMADADAKRPERDEAA